MTDWVDVGSAELRGISRSKNTRLMRDLSRLIRSNTEVLGFSLELKNDDALNEWSINLFGFSDCPLAEVGPFPHPPTLDPCSICKNPCPGCPVDGCSQLR